MLPGREILARGDYYGKTHSRSGLPEYREPERQAVFAIDVFLGTNVPDTIADDPANNRTFPHFSNLQKKTELVKTGRRI